MWSAHTGRVAPLIIRSWHDDVLGVLHNDCCAACFIEAQEVATFCPRRLAFRRCVGDMERQLAEHAMPEHCAYCALNERFHMSVALQFNQGCARLAPAST